MKKTLRSISSRLQKIGFYIPFSFYFLLFTVGCFLVWLWLRNKVNDSESSYTDIFKLLVRVAFYSCITIVSFAFLSAVISFIYFFIKKKNDKILFNVKLLNTNTDKLRRQTVEINLHPVLKPLLGFVKLRLLYDGNFSNKFSLIEINKKQLFSNKINGIYHWHLPEIKEYRIESAVIYFEDFFQFFSFALPLETANTFATTPYLNDSKIINAFPRKTEDTATRIEELRRVEGELINYKSFESNDDVRRIVWKIYAKNKELVVRIPEIMDPYASHIYLYASFYTGFNVNGNSVVNIPFLNYYKNAVWTVFKQLQQKGYEVRFVPDNASQQNGYTNDDVRVQQAISTSVWQKNAELKSYCKTKDAAVLIVSSLSDAQEVQNIVSAFGDNIIIVFVKLTDSLNENAFASWVKWLFVNSDSTDIASYKRLWSLSALKGSIQKNENILEHIISQSEKFSVV